MFCPNCGAPNQDTATQCGSCGTYLNMQQSAAPAPAAQGAYPSAQPVAPVPNYLVPAILTMFCCWPLSIVAIVFATQVNSKAAAGDYVGAQAASQKAKTWAMISFICGLIGVFLQIAIAVAGGA
jgi:uncharacterized membrane protein YvbJ